jgi:RimJ/RimL family protein N-acetyltransferase
MSPFWTLRTARLILTPVGGADLAELRSLKGDPRVFAIMQGGVRDHVRTAAELADNVAAWGRDGYGIWSIRQAEHNRFVGIAGLEARLDGRGIALRFALEPEAQGRGMAREAASAALRYGHDRARLPRIVAVAREANFGSRTVLGSIGMVQCDTFEQQGHAMVLYESRVAPESISPGNFIPLGRSAASSP